jgi:hypothetical protein
MKADDCVRNAVFVVWMEETSALIEADASATAAAASAVLLPVVRGELNPAPVH